VANEIDATLAAYLADTLRHCQNTCEQAGIDFDFSLIQHDFIEDGVGQLRDPLFKLLRQFNCAILNPPYKKINSDSDSASAFIRLGAGR